MGKGYLSIIARTANNAIPLEGVRISLKNQEGTVLKQLTTDSSGKTETFALAAVDRSLSLDPNNSGIPFTNYELTAKLDGFNSLNIKNVQIFDGETALQPVVLYPMSSAQKSPYIQKLVISPQAVRMTAPRHQVGTTASPILFQQVIIPNPITIHLGAPNASATNVQVSFPDYVKNSVSSEIYPTWPQASLEANIYAIITFALNRVFTQWYRSRGYNFDITNSTAYDQYFVYGRTIYESISKIVDDIFNQYVKRPKQDAPYFTAFCNGTTATCNGLSQWGTVSLADQGLNSLQILRYYYPNDIIIAETNIITGIVESYPGTALRLGSTGQAVETIQIYLNRIRVNYPAIPLITDETGVFGSSTEAAVKKFQSIFNLTQDGIVGKATWNKISAIYVSVTKLASLDSEGTDIGIGTVAPSSTLKIGSSGPDVITLQYILSYISEFYPNIPQLVQDGIFGYATETAVKAFQEMMGLPVTGVVNQATWLALYDVYWGIESVNPYPEGEVFEYIVKPGDTLWLLAQRFETSIEVIKVLNNLTSDTLYVGQLLLIPNTNTTSAIFTYIVQPGDSLWSLAQRFDTTVNEIMMLNNLSSDQLSVGQSLQIPGALVTYIVQPGDSLWSISFKFNTTVESIKTVNKLTSDTIWVGQTLYILQ